MHKSSSQAVHIKQTQFIKSVYGQEAETFIQFVGLILLVFWHDQEKAT